TARSVVVTVTARAAPPSDAAPSEAAPPSGFANAALPPARIVATTPAAVTARIARVRRECMATPPPSSENPCRRRLPADYAEVRRSGPVRAGRPDARRPADHRRWSPAVPPTRRTGQHRTRRGGKTGGSATRPRAAPAVLRGSAPAADPGGWTFVTPAQRRGPPGQEPGRRHPQRRDPRATRLGCGARAAGEHPPVRAGRGPAGEPVRPHRHRRVLATPLRRAGARVHRRAARTGRRRVTWRRVTRRRRGRRGGGARPAASGATAAAACGGAPLRRPGSRA